MLKTLMSTTLAVGTLGVVLGMSFLLIGSRVSLDDMPFKKEIGCMLNLDVGCLSDDVSALRETRDATLAEIDALQAERDLLEGKGVIRTSSGDLGGFYVVVTAAYDDPIGKSGLRAAHCHAARDTAFRDPEMLLARAINGQIVATGFDQARAIDLGISSADAQRALAACPWPSK